MIMIERKKAFNNRNYYSWGKQRCLIYLSICNCLQGAGDFRKQIGEAYLPYVSQADRGNIKCSVSSY